MSFNVNQAGGNVAFFSASMFRGATQQIAQSPLQQLQQLQQLFQSAFQNMGGGGGFNAGGGFAQTPFATPGFTPPPSTGMMQPTNPGAFQGGGFVAGGFATASGPNGMAAGGFMVGGGFGNIGTPAPQKKTGLIQTGKNEFVTPGGYKISAEGKSMAWNITGPDGKKTRIWGDPHVHESDGGKWDFKHQMSFVLPDGTKITCKTKPAGKGPNAPTFSSDIDIMNGNQRATISGIDKNKPVSTGVKNDRWAVDAKTKDGNYAVLGGNGDDWFLNGKNEIVGGNMRTGEIFTKAGGSRGISQDARNAMRETPRFGAQQFMQQMMQQMMQRMLMQLFMPKPFMF